MNSGPTLSSVHRTFHRRHLLQVGEILRHRAADLATVLQELIFHFVGTRSRGLRAVGRRLFHQTFTLVEMSRTKRRELFKVFDDSHDSVTFRLTGRRRRRRRRHHGHVRGLVRARIDLGQRGTALKDFFFCRGLLDHDRSGFAPPRGSGRSW